jgi:hypothetical protein
MQIRMIKICKLISITPILLLISCAHIPQESVQLSQSVGKGISDQNRAYVNLLNEYFTVKKKSIDDFIFSTYTPEFMSRIRSKMKAEGFSEIPDSVSQKIVKMIVAKRDSMQSSLEQVKAGILTVAENNSILLLNANSAVTALLNSAVSVDKATQNALQKSDSLSPAKFKFAEFEKTFDQYLIDIGNGSAKATDLYDNANQTLNGGN